MLCTFRPFPVYKAWSFFFVGTGRFLFVFSFFLHLNLIISSIIGFLNTRVQESYATQYIHMQSQATIAGGACATPRVTLLEDAI